jgi:hypothetical protein
MEEKRTSEVNGARQSVQVESSPGRRVSAIKSRAVSNERTERTLMRAISEHGPFSDWQRIWTSLG